MLHVHRTTLPLGAHCWAAVGKDPGFSPRSLLELLKRRGQHRAEDFARLDLVEPIDLIATKEVWRVAVDEAEKFVRSRPAEPVGCLFWSTATQQFVMPGDSAVEAGQIVPRFGRPGGVLAEPRPSGRMWLATAGPDWSSFRADPRNVLR